MAGGIWRAPWPFRHVGLKLVSAALAVAIWLAVAGEETVERGLRIPLELQQFPLGLELQTEPPSLVDVRVRGASGELSRLGQGDIMAVLDLHGVRPGRRLFQLTPEQVRVPFGIEVVQVMPTSVVMVFENSATRTVPVVPSVEGAPAPGYILGKMTADPATVEIIGPKSAVSGVTEALTETVSIAGAQSSIQETVSIGVLDPSVRLKPGTPATVRVEVLPGPRERTLRDRPVHLRNLNPGLTARALPSSVVVVLRGSREGLSRVQLYDVNAFVDLAGLGAGEYSLPIDVDESPDAGVLRVDPAHVQVRITSAKD